jgi:hypothetical protein
MPATNIAQRKKQTNGSLPHSELVDFTFDTYGPLVFGLASDR